MFVPDLDAYFDRIGYAADRRPTLANLHAILAAHVASIPFENLDILLGRGIDLDPAVVQRKLISERRGGYCFEQNSLLLQVLTALGYRATPLSARVRIGRERTFVPPRTHVLVRVELDEGSWIADVGVGALSMACALRLDTEEPQSTPHESRRLVRGGRWAPGELRAPDSVLYHQVLRGEVWEDVYDFTLEAMPDIDRELGNWFTSTHPRSHFKDRLMVARATESGRLTVIDRAFKTRDHTGRSETRILETPDELLEVLEQRFGLWFPAGTRFTCPSLDWPQE